MSKSLSMFLFANLFFNYLPPVQIQEKKNKAKDISTKRPVPKIPP